MGKTSDAANGLPAQLEQVRDKLTDSGEAVAATAAQVKDQVLATAVTAKDRAVDMAKDVADQVPSNQQELEEAFRALVETIRKNPKPWVIGATIAGVIWLLGRSSKR
jgi:DNA anti-recombination protein RmuC